MRDEHTTVRLSLILPAAAFMLALLTAPLAAVSAGEGMEASAKGSASGEMQEQAQKADEQSADDKGKAEEESAEDQENAEGNDGE